MQMMCCYWSSIMKIEPNIEIKRHIFILRWMIYHGFKFKSRNTPGRNIYWLDHDWFIPNCCHHEYSISEQKIYKRKRKQMKSFECNLIIFPDESRLMFCLCSHDYEVIFSRSKHSFPAATAMGTVPTPSLFSAPQLCNSWSIRTNNMPKFISCFNSIMYWLREKKLIITSSSSSYAPLVNVSI